MNEEPSKKNLSLEKEISTDTNMIFLLTIFSFILTQLAKGFLMALGFMIAIRILK